jgi:hypothetical protein
VRRIRARLVKSSGHVLEQIRAQGPRPDDHTLLPLVSGAVRIA